MENEDCITQMFDYLEKSEVEPKPIKIKSMSITGGYDLELTARNGLRYGSGKFLKFLST